MPFSYTDLPAGIRPYDREDAAASTVDLQAAREKIDALLDGMIAEFYEKIPFASHLGSASKVDVEYYKRFTVEIILRLRMKRVIDGLTIHYLAKNNPRLAKRWCHYTEDEMLHDGLFLADLERLGMTKQQVYGTDPFFATKLLQGYFYYGLEHEGVPLASLSSSYFLEYTASRTQELWLDNIERSLGEGAVKGSRSHVDHDEEDDHTGFVWEVLSAFIATESDVEKIENHLRGVYHLFMMFFVELHASTVEKSDDAFRTVYNTLRAA